MLVLTRKLGESITIGENIKILIVDIEGHQRNTKISVALEQIKVRTAFVKVLGSYPKKGKRKDKSRSC